MDCIINEMGLVKYWWLIVDSTQMFHMLINCLLYLTHKLSHKGRSLCDDILALFSKNCSNMAQTYDTSNTLVEYSSLQACVREKPFRLLLTIPTANCKSERSFSVLKCIKDMLEFNYGRWEIIFISKVEYWKRDTWIARFRKNYIRLC